MGSYHGGSSGLKSDPTNIQAMHILPHPPPHPNMAASGSENLDGVGRNAKLKASEKQSTNQ